MVSSFITPQTPVPHGYEARYFPELFSAAKKIIVSLRRDRFTGSSECSATLLRFVPPNGVPSFTRLFYVSQGWYFYFTVHGIKSVNSGSRYWHIRNTINIKPSTKTCYISRQFLLIARNMSRAGLHKSRAPDRRGD